MTVRDEISSLLEEVRVRGMRAATYATEAQRRHQAEAIDMLVVQALKLIEAEWNALLAEIHDAEKAAGEAQTALELIEDEFAEKAHEKGAA